MAKRDASDRIPWDYKSLSKLAQMPASSFPVQPTSASLRRKKLRVVWIKVPEDPFDDHTCTSAVKQGLLHERPATWSIIQEFVAKSGWEQFGCQLLQSLGENITLSAEPSKSHDPEGELQRRKKTAATYMSSSKGVVAMSAICGRTLLVRRDGADLLQHTPWKSCAITLMP